MKKFLLIMVCLALSSPVFAKTIIVQSMSSFSSTKPQSNLTFKAAETKDVKEGYTIKQGTVINSRVEKVTEPKRGKRNVYVVVHPTNLNIPDRKGRDLHAKITPYKKMNKKNAAQKGAVSAAGIMLPGFAQLFYFGKGFANPEKGKSRMASGGRCAYKNSPLVYIEKGDELYIHQGDYLKMKLYHK